MDRVLIKHGVIAGVCLGVWQGLDDTWNNDVVSTGEQLGEAVVHPVSTVENIWHSLF